MRDTVQDIVLIKKKLSFIVSWAWVFIKKQQNKVFEGSFLIYAKNWALETTHLLNWAANAQTWKEVFLFIPFLQILPQQRVFSITGILLNVWSAFSLSTFAFNFFLADSICLSELVLIFVLKTTTLKRCPIVQAFFCF